MKWTKEKDEYLKTLIHNHGTKWTKLAEKMQSKFDEPFSREKVRSRWRLHLRNEPPDIDPTDEYGVKINRDNKNNTIEIDQLIEISKTDLKNDDYILKAHGYDPKKWEITSHQFSMWHHHNKQDGTKTLYASKIKITPKKNTLDFNELLAEVKKVPKVKVKTNASNEETYLNIPLSDMHFGIADYDYYKPTQEKIIDLIKNKHKEILFILGNDLLHVDNFRNTTASGREIQHVDITKAWRDAKSFYYPLFEQALKNSEKVSVVYIKGNHSESLEWCFVQMLKERYPQAQFDDEVKERKAHMLGRNLIFANHGDKKKAKNLPENFAVEFPNLWSKANTRTLYTGHLHHEMVIDKGGLLVRQLPSGINPDQWHDDMGYTTAHKRFQVHEFTYDDEKCIYYV